MEKIKEIESKLTALVEIRWKKYGPSLPDPLPALVLELAREMIRLRQEIEGGLS